MGNQNVRTKLILAGVKNLHVFGYENACVDNIISDEVYAMFFKSMLEENLGAMKSIDPKIRGLIAEIDAIHG